MQWDSSPNITWQWEGMYFFIQAKIGSSTSRVKPTISIGDNSITINSRATKIKDGAEGKATEGVKGGNACTGSE